MPGGGGASGTVAFPTYMEDQHHEFINLGAVGGVAPTDSLVEIVAVLQDPLNNPHTDHVFTEPKVEFDGIDQRLLAMLNSTRALQPKVIWCDQIKEAAQKVDDCVHELVETQAIITEGLADALRLFEALEGLDIQNLLATGDALTDFGAELKEFADTADLLGSLNYLQLITDMGVQAELIVDDAKLDTNTGVAVPADWAALVDQAVTTADAAGVLSPVTRQTLVDTILAASITGADNFLDAAVAAAVLAANDALLSSLVTEFELRQQDTKAKSMRRFMGFMADAGATHSSAFLVGLALIETDHDRIVADFSSQLAIETYREGLRAYLQTYVAQLELELRSALAVKQARDTFVLQGSAVMSTLKQNQWQYEQFWMSLYTDIQRQLVAGGIQTEIATKAARDGLVGQGLGVLTNLISNNYANRAQLLNAFAGAFSESIRMHLSGVVGSLDIRQRYINQAQTLMQDLTARKLVVEQGAINSMIEAARIGHILQAEYEGATMDKDVSMALWNMDVLERAVAVLSGPAGMPARIAPRNSRVSSAAGGALGGASIGAGIGTAVPGIGTAAGAAAGAILGGLGGYFQ